MTVQTLIAEAGLDRSRWPTEYHFVSWIGLAPRNEVSGGKVLKKKIRKVVSRLATALRMAALTLRTSQSYLGAQFRRLQIGFWRVDHPSGPDAAISAPSEVSWRAAAPRGSERSRDTHQRTCEPAAGVMNQRSPCRATWQWVRGQLYPSRSGQLWVSAEAGERKSAEPMAARLDTNPVSTPARSGALLNPCITPSP
jgi:hypothetical protein